MLEFSEQIIWYLEIAFATRIRLVEKAIISFEQDSETTVFVKHMLQSTKPQIKRIASAT